MLTHGTVKAVSTASKTNILGEIIDRTKLNKNGIEDNLKYLIIKNHVEVLLMKIYCNNAE
jgi:hypothetical protein